MKHIFFCLILSVLTSCLSAQTNKINYNYVDKADLKEYINILASDSLEGRFTGSVGQKKAAKYIAEKFQEFSLLPYSQQSYFEPFQLKQISWGEIYIRTKKKTLYNAGKISYLGLKSQNEERKIELVFGGYGSEEEIGQINVKNKMVLVFSKNIRASYFTNVKLQELGAYGVIYANTENNAQFNAIKNSQGNYVIQKRLIIQDRDSTIHYGIDFQEFAIANDEIQALIGETIWKLNEYINNKNLTSCPTATIYVKSEQKRELIETENVIGILPGKLSKSIIISAHYDHLGKTDGRIFHGADDNASGTSALMEIAETFSKIKDLKYTMVFVATTAEEEGLIGSRIYTNSEDFNSENILVDLNIDMIGRNDKTHSKRDCYIYPIGVKLYPEFQPYFEHADSLFSGCTFDYSNSKGKVSSFYRASDQYSFYKKDIPSIMFFTGLHKDYHTPKDIPEKINYDVLSDRIKLICHVIQEIQTNL